MQNGRQEINEQNDSINCDNSELSDTVQSTANLVEVGIQFKEKKLNYIILAILCTLNLINYVDRFTVAGILNFCYF